jgi:hypothetical protein
MAAPSGASRLGKAGTPPRLVKLCPVPAWDPHGSGDGTRQRGRKRVLSGTDVPRLLPTAAVPRTSQPGQITGFRRRGYVCGAGGARTHDRRIMSSLAWRSGCAACTDTTDTCRHDAHSTHFRQWLGPRTGPRLTAAIASCRSHKVTTARAATSYDQTVRRSRPWTRVLWATRATLVPPSYW